MNKEKKTELAIKMLTLFFKVLASILCVGMIGMGVFIVATGKTELWND